MEYFYLFISPSLVTLAGSSARRRRSGAVLLSLVLKMRSTVAVVGDGPRSWAGHCPSPFQTSLSPCSPRERRRRSARQRVERKQVPWTLVLAPRERESRQTVPEDQSRESQGGQRRAVLSPAGAPRAPEGAASEDAIHLQAQQVAPASPEPSSQRCPWLLSTNGAGFSSNPCHSSPSQTQTFLALRPEGGSSFHTPGFSPGTSTQSSGCEGEKRARTQAASGEPWAAEP